MTKQLEQTNVVAPEEKEPAQRKTRFKPKQNTGYLFCPRCYGPLEHDEQGSFCEKCERRLGSS